MADDLEKERVPQDAAALPGTPRGGFVASIVDIFADPFKVFARIDAGLTWWKPFVTVCAVAMLLAYLMLPVQRRLMELNPRGLSEEQLQTALEGYGKFAGLGLIMVPIILIVSYLITAGIMHLIINVMSSRSSFKKTLSLVSFCGLIAIVEQIIGGIVIRSRGFEAIESPADARFSLSLAPLLGSGTGFLNAVLQSLSIFQIWYYIVLILGIAAIFKMSRKAAIVPVIPIWIISIIFAWIGGKFSGAAG